MRHTVAVAGASDTTTGGTQAHRALTRGLEALGLGGRESLERDLLRFLALVAQWSRAYNLTAVRGELAMVERHLLDSLSAHPWVPAGRVADLGTGAGMPGIPLALALPDRQFTLVDSVGKKIRFVRHACRELALDNVVAVQARVEAYRPERPFDGVIARALAPLDRLAELALPLLRPGGRLLAMVGRDPGHADTPGGFDSLEVRGVQVPFLAAERHLVIARRAE